MIRIRMIWSLGGQRLCFGGRRRCGWYNFLIVGLFGVFGGS